MSELECSLLRLFFFHTFQARNEAVSFTLQTKTHQPSIRHHRCNAKQILSSPAKCKHAIQPAIHGTTHRLCLLTYPVPLQFPLLRVTDWEWQKVRDTISFFLCLCVSDPLQRDANQVYLAATQRLLAAHHASEQRGRSLQLPRYRHGVPNYHMCGVILQWWCVEHWWSAGKTGGETVRQRWREFCILQRRNCHFIWGLDWPSGDGKKGHSPRRLTCRLGWHSCVFFFSFLIAQKNRLIGPLFYFS